MPLLAWADAAASVVFATGSPLVSSVDGVTRPLLRGAELNAGDMINTADGQVQLRFADGASMSLKPATQFRIDAFRFVDRGNRASPGDGVVMSLIKGTLRTVSGLLGKEDHSQYKVGTSVATIGIRGTEYGATMDGSGLSVTTYRGRVEVCSEAGCQQIGPGETVWVYDRSAKPTLEPRTIGVPSLEMQPALPQAPAVNTPTPNMPSPTPNDMPGNRYQGPATYGK